MEQRITVLFVEDNDEHAELFERNLRIAQFYNASIKRAVELEEAISYISKEQFDIIVLDLGLPETKGIGTLKKFQKRNLTAPVIVFTLNDDVELSLESIRHGAQDFIFKGEFSPGIITRSIRYAMERFPLVRKLEAINSSLETFAAAAAHDLKSPLRHINTNMNFLREDFGDEISEAANEYIDSALESATHLDNLIQSLLDFSKLGSEVQNREISHIEKAIERAMGLLNEEIVSSTAKIHIEEGLPSLFIDEMLMVRVFLNLISNSLKYVDEQAPEICIGSTENDSEYLISVSDNGIGIDEAYLEQIFLPLERLHSRTSKYPGTGIGLASCARIIKAHGGRIWAESQPGEGSVFYFTIPKYNK